MRKSALALVPLILVAAFATEGLYRRPSPNPIRPRDDNSSTSVTEPPGSASRSEQTTDQWASNLFFGVFSHDFGSVPFGTELKHRFKMKNIYAVPLQITGIRHSCGCLSFSTSHANRKPLPPGEEGWIDIEVDSRRITGYKKIKIYITVGREFNSTAGLDITVDVR